MPRQSSIQARRTREVQNTWLRLVVVLLAGLVGGFVNVMAGGGSFLTLVALEFAGLPAAMANGTNRLGVVTQNVTGLLGFRSKGLANAKTSLQLAVPAFLGSIVGAYIVVDLPEVLFHRILAVAMIVVLFTVVFDVKKWLKIKSFEMTPKRRMLSYGVFFLIGIYGGAIQAGVGFFVIAALVMVAGQNLVITNSYKVLIIALLTVVALVIFILKGQVDWLLGLVLAVGNGVGGWISSRLSVEKGEKLVKIVLAVMLSFVALQYLGIIPSF